MVFWLVVVLGSVTLARITLGIYQSIRIADELYDEQLSNSADSCATRVHQIDGKIVAVIPPDTLETFTHGHRDRFYYEVFNENGERLAGNTNILNPMLSPSAADQKRLFFLDTKPERLRVMQDQVSLPNGQWKKVFVMTAETLHSREELTTRIVTSMVVAQILVIIASFTMVLVVTNKVFAPLTRLRQAISNRRANDLSPLDESAGPDDVKPLVSAINSLLERSRKEVESRNQFIANAAHQLRTPIAGLKTYSSFGLRLKTEDEMRELLKKLDLGLDRTTRLMNQLLSLARAEHMSLVPTDLYKLVAERIEEYQNMADEKEVELEFTHSGGKENSFMLEGDANGLRDLAANLIENSVRYVSRHGYVKVSLTLKEESIQLAVQDDGPGIPEEARQKVFERFYRIPGSIGEGSGLGLSIVWEVVRAHQAKVTISEPPDGGKGTLITVEFPRSANIEISA